MTGRELIIYILENHLEDVELFEDGKIPGLMTVEEAAVSLKTGTHCINTLMLMGRLEYVKINNTIYIYESSVRKECEREDKSN